MKKANKNIPRRTHHEGGAFESELDFFWFIKNGLFGNSGSKRIIQKIVLNIQRTARKKLRHKKGTRKKVTGTFRAKSACHLFDKKCLAPFLCDKIGVVCPLEIAYF